VQEKKEEYRQACERESRKEKLRGILVSLEKEDATAGKRKGGIRRKEGKTVFRRKTEKRALRKENDSTCTTRGKGNVCFGPLNQKD